MEQESLPQAEASEACSVVTYFNSKGRFDQISVPQEKCSKTFSGVFLKLVTSKVLEKCSRKGG